MIIRKKRIDKQDDVDHVLSSSSVLLHVSFDDIFDYYEKTITNNESGHFLSWYIVAIFVPTL